MDKESFLIIATI